MKTETFENKFEKEIFETSRFKTTQRFHCCRVKTLRFESVLAVRTARKGNFENADANS